MVFKKIVGVNIFVCMHSTTLSSDNSFYPLFGPRCLAAGLLMLERNLKIFVVQQHSVVFLSLHFYAIKRVENCKSIEEKFLFQSIPCLLFELSVW